MDGHGSWNPPQAVCVFIQLSYNTVSLPSSANIATYLYPLSNSDWSNWDVTPSRRVISLYYRSNLFASKCSTSLHYDHILIALYQQKSIFYQFIMIVYREGRRIWMHSLIRVIFIFIVMILSITFVQWGDHISDRWAVPLKPWLLHALLYLAHLCWLYGSFELCFFSRNFIDNLPRSHY